MDATTDDGEVLGPGRSTVESGSGTVVRDSATTVGGDPHLGTKCILGSTGEAKVTCQALIQLSLDIGAEPGGAGELR
jgi:hypothetical protein